MKRKFKPYLDIKDKKQLQLLLKRQNSIEENYFDLSQIKECTVEAFKEGVIKLKNFYGYTPKGDDVEFIDEIIYHMLVIQSFVSDIGYGFFYTAVAAANPEELEKSWKDYFEDEDKPFLKFLVNELIDINKFIEKYYGKEFFKLRQYSVEEFMKMNSEEFMKIMNKIRAVILILATYLKNLRLKMLIFNIVHFTFLPPQAYQNKS